MKTNCRFILTLTMVMVICPPTFANDFGARTYPFAPRLIENHSPTLCNAYLSQVKEGFFSKKVDLVVTNMKGIQWLDWKPIRPESANEPLDFWRLDLDLDGSGKKRTLVLHKSEQTYGSGTYQQRDAFFFESPAAFDEWLSRNPATEEAFKGIKQYFPGEVITSQAPSYEIYSGGEHRWFAFEGKYFFLTSEALGSDFSGVAYLTPDGSRKLACVVRVSPPSEVMATFESLPGLKSYLKRLWTIGHASGGPCGTLHSEDRHDAQAQQAVSRAAIRPWATSNRLESDISRAVYYGYDERMLQFLEDWGYQDAWNYREYQTYLNHIPAAIKALEDYYRKAFGIPEKLVKQRAKFVFEQLTAAHFLIPASYEPGHYPFFRSPEESAIHRALLQGESKDVVSLVAPDKLAANAGWYLFESVEHPHLLQLLIDAGADVNTTNAWGKTPLMVAAHMNRPDSVRLLLKRGANPNLQTTTMSQCGMTIDRGNRTALMYAAENADVEVMRALVEAGAETDVIDSKGNDIAFYLAMNPVLSEAEKKMSVAQLFMSRKAENFTRPSFNCAVAKRWDEKLICKDLTLAGQDQWLASAFAAWKGKLRVPEEARVDQGAWIKRRSEQCRPFEEEDLAISCLQLETRARIRYVQSRIVE